MVESRHAFLIMAHKNPMQLKKLLSLLDHKRADLYVHIDKKSRSFDPAFFSDAVKQSKLVFIPRMTVIWGSDKQIQCEFKLIEAALPGKYAYYHLLSGLDLPLKRIDDILDFFDTCGEKEFVSFQGKTVSPEVYQRASLYWPFQGTRVFRPLFLRLQHRLILFQKKRGVDRLKKGGVTLYKGANWFSCTHGYLSLLVRDKAKLISIFSHSFCADEVFLQTHLMTTEYRDRLYDSTFSDSCRSVMRLIDWERGTPYTFRMDDLELLSQTELLFARKFDENLDSEIIEYLVKKQKQ